MDVTVSPTSFRAHRPTSCRRPARKAPHSEFGVREPEIWRPGGAKGISKAFREPSAVCIFDEVPPV